jgi:hypothetical protein
MADVFISYANENRERAYHLASAFEARGWSVWWDRKIIAGQTFDLAIERELDAAKSVVVLWSKDSVASEWVKNEASRAVERGVLIPAIVDDARLPLEFRRRQTADLIGWNGDMAHAGFLSLCDGIAANAGRKSAPQTPPPVHSIVHPSLRRKWIAAAGLILFALVFGVYWRFMRSAEPPIVEKSGELAELADSVVGTYYGDVVSDSQGSSQSDVTVTVTKVGARRVKVTSDYARLGTVEVDLTKTGSIILSSSSAIVLSLNLDERPSSLSYNPGGIAYYGKKR